MTSPDRPTLLLVEDDELSREMLTLLAADAGFGVLAFDSGLSVLEYLSRQGTPKVVVLADMQMPGLCGDSLATLVRSASHPDSIVLAMSASPVRPEQRRQYDAFLLKPFTMEQVAQAVAQAEARRLQPADSADPAVLDDTVLGNLAEMMQGQQLQQLYQLCVDDTLRRADLLIAAAAAGDAKAWRAAAHAVKGGALMVGATEIAAVAASLEQDQRMLFSLKGVEQLVCAVERFKRILAEHLLLLPLHSPTQHPGDA